MYTGTEIVRSFIVLFVSLVLRIGSIVKYLTDAKSMVRVADRIMCAFLSRRGHDYSPACQYGVNDRRETCRNKLSR